jgi:hypothetical protein
MQSQTPLRLRLHTSCIFFKIGFSAEGVSGTRLLMQYPVCQTLYARFYHLFYVFGIADIALGECCFSVSGVYFVGYGLSVFSFTSDKINEVSFCESVRQCSSEI